MWIFLFSSRRRHTRLQGDWSSDVCSSDLEETLQICCQMWSREDGKFQGKHYQLRETLNSPQSLTKPHPPILIGGGGEKRSEERRVGKERWARCGECINEQQSAMEMSLHV